MHDHKYRRLRRDVHLSSEICALRIRDHNLSIAESLLKICADLIDIEDVPS